MLFGPTTTLLHCQTASQLASQPANYQRAKTNVKMFEFVTNTLSGHICWAQTNDVARWPVF